jgi:hypothetical protein
MRTLLNSFSVSPPKRLTDTRGVAGTVELYPVADEGLLVEAEGRYVD